MKLWLLSQDVNVGYDTYDSVVVAAETEEEARMIHPNFYLNDIGEWDGKYSEDDAWCDAVDVKVECIGEAAPHIKKGVILASFNAG